MWKLVVAVLFNCVLVTLQSVEKPMGQTELHDEEFIADLREFLRDDEKMENMNPSFSAFKAKKNIDKVDKTKSPFTFISKYKQFRLASVHSAVNFNCTTNDPNASYKLIHELSMPPFIKKTLAPDGVKLTQDGAIFSLKNPSLQDGGKYYCVADNQQGEQIQQQPLMLFITTQIFLHVRPNIEPAVKYAEFGDDVTFTCHARGLGYSLRWEEKDENGVFMEVPSELVSDLPSKTEQGDIRQAISLNLEDVRPPPYSKTFRCCLNFQGDLRYAYAMLEVRVPEKPNITNLPTYIGITEGSDFEYTCKAAGSPPPMIMWSKDGNILTNCKLTGSCYLKGNNYIISGEHNEVLRLEGADVVENSGNIVCHALNVAGMDEDVTLVRVYDEGYIPSNHHTKFKD